MGGFGSYGIVGTPDDVADDLVRLHQAGFTEATVSFIDYVGELPLFIEDVLPRL